MGGSGCRGGGTGGGGRDRGEKDGRSRPQPGRGDLLAASPASPGPARPQASKFESRCGRTQNTETMGCGSSRAHGRAAGPGACCRSRPSHPVVHLTQSSRFSLTRAILASLEQERLARKAARKTSPQSKRLRRVSFSDDVKEPLEHSGGEKEGQSQPAASSGRKL